MSSAIAKGDLVDAEYVANGYGATALLRGIVTGIGEWEGNPTYSVAGFDAQGMPASTSQSTMPVSFVSSRLSESTRDFMRLRYRETTGRLADKLERIADEDMGMSL